MIQIVAYQIPMGLPAFHQRLVPGYKLANGAVLLDSERDKSGLYYGGAGMDGMYLKTGEKYEIVRDGDGKAIGANRVK